MSDSGGEIEVTEEFEVEEEVEVREDVEEDADEGDDEMLPDEEAFLEEGPIPPGTRGPNLGLGEFEPRGDWQVVDLQAEEEAFSQDLQSLRKDQSWHRKMAVDLSKQSDFKSTEEALANSKAIALHQADALEAQAQELELRANKLTDDATLRSFESKPATKDWAKAEKWRTQASNMRQHEQQLMDVASKLDRTAWQAKSGELNNAVLDQLDQLAEQLPNDFLGGTMKMVVQALKIQINRP
jgi:hypothetical protein